MTSRLQVPWPDARLFADRGGRPFRILTVADEVDETLDSLVTRPGSEPWTSSSATERCRSTTSSSSPMPSTRRSPRSAATTTWKAPGPVVPPPVAPARTAARRRALDPRRPDRGRLNGVPFHGGEGLQVPDFTTWRSVLGAWAKPRRIRGRPGAARGPPAAPAASTTVLTACTRYGTAGWLAGRLRPPLWLHGQRRSSRGGSEDRAMRGTGRSSRRGPARISSSSCMLPGSAVAPALAEHRRRSSARPRPPEEEEADEREPNHRSVRGHPGGFQLRRAAGAAAAGAPFIFAWPRRATTACTRVADRCRLTAARSSRALAERSGGPPGGAAQRQESARAAITVVVSRTVTGQSSVVERLVDRQRVAR